MSDRIIVCGGRDYWDAVPMRLLMAAVCAEYDDPVIVHGAAPGADSTCARIAEEMGMRTEAHPADWQSYGRSAGPARNGEMIALGASFVLAFPGGRGTADLCGRAARAGIRILRVVSA